MPIIRNNVNSRILILLKGGKSIDLLEKSTVEVTDDDLLSSHLQDLIQREFVIKENEVQKEVEKESGKEGKVENPDKEKEAEKNVDKGLSKDKEDDLNNEKEIINEANEDLSKEKEADENSVPKKNSSMKKGK